jgi:putative copper resistance protein D
MGQHMFLAMVAPLFIVLGSPLSMALDVLPDKGTGQDVELRALIVDVMDSKVTRFLTNPLFVLLFFSLSTYPIYFSSLFGWVMGNHLGHTLMLMHFLVAGLLFYIVVVGVDPIPNRPTAPVRAALLVLTMPVHAAFGVIVLSAKHILGGSYYNVVGLPWNVDLKHEQAIGGGLAWVFGEIPFVLVLGIIFIQWIRSEAKEAKEVDAASGSGDPDDELAAYNDYLSSLNKRAPKK